MTTVRFFAGAKAATGVPQIEVSGTTVGEVLARCAQEYPALGKVLPKCSFLLNEVSCLDLASQVKPEDQLDVLPPFAGG